MLRLASPARTLLALLAIISSTATSQEQQETEVVERHPRLAVLVPISNHGTSIEHVSMRCPSSGVMSSPDVDLVLFRMLRPGEVELADGAVVPEVSAGSSRRCFARVRTLNHRIDEEEINHHHTDAPSSSRPSSEMSEMLFSAFLDYHVHSQLSAYDALAVFPSLPGAHDNSVGDSAASISVAFLCDEAFAHRAIGEQALSAGSNEDGSFWVKTLVRGEDGEDSSKKLRGGQGASSSLDVVSQSTSEGGISGVKAVIYNNSDAEFMTYVRAASKQWQQKQPQTGGFDEALSRALESSLYEKYASKFISVNLESPTSGKSSGVATAAMDVRRLAHKTGKRSNKNPLYTKWMADEKWRDTEKYKTLEKWMGDEESGVEPKWMSGEKWKGDEENGVEPKWMLEEKWKGDEEAGVDPKWKTNRCLADCTHTNKDGTTGRVCDISCEDGVPYGTHGCSAKGGKYGLFCRRCYNDITRALRHDTPDDRAIMCDTLSPPSIYAARNLASTMTSPESTHRVTRRLWSFKENEGDENNIAELAPAATTRGHKRNNSSDRQLAHEEAGKRSSENKVAGRKLSYTKWMTDEKWKDTEKYKTLEKWMGDEESGVEPKWMSEEKWKGDEENGVEPKWKTNRCLADCTHTSKDGTKGRACDISCEDGMPYGTRGCSAKGGKYGLFCRLCFNDITKAFMYDTPDDRAIMCDTMAPPSVYSYSRLSLGDDAFGG